jgi:hypothetical protein
MHVAHELYSEFAIGPEFGYIVDGSEQFGLRAASRLRGRVEEKHAEHLEP